MSKGCPVTSETHIIWVPLNCWLGSVVWNLGTSLWKGLLLRGTLRIPSHWAPNQQSTISWIPVFTQQWESVSVSFVDFFLGGFSFLRSSVVNLQKFLSQMLNGTGIFIPIHEWPNYGFHVAIVPWVAFEFVRRVFFWTLNYRTCVASGGIKRSRSNLTPIGKGPGSQ